MSKVTTLPEHTDFLKKVLQLTRMNELAWDVTADPDVLLAPLSDDYRLKLEEVPDLSHDSDEPDHQLTLIKDGRTIFILDRLAFPDLDVFRKSFAASDVHPYTVLKELWDRAQMKANKVADELDRVNSILEARIKGEVPF